MKNSSVQENRCATYDMEVCKNKLELRARRVYIQAEGKD
jgi:hypothetical protein